jgi:hypothetical protein
MNVKDLLRASRCGIVRPASTAKPSPSQVPDYGIPELCRARLRKLCDALL